MSKKKSKIFDEKIKKIKQISQEVIDKPKSTFMISLIILAFFLGFFSSKFFIINNFSETQYIFQSNELDLISFFERNKFNDLFYNHRCNPQILKSMSNILYNTSILLDNLEKENKINTKYYTILKRRHNLNQVLYYVEFKKMKDRCNLSTNMILFFFNSSEPDKAKQIGNELDKLIMKKHYDIDVLPMDYRFTPSLKFFYDYYNITNLPCLVINYKTEMCGLFDYKTIEKYLDK